MVCYYWNNPNEFKPKYGQRVVVSDGKLIDFATFMKDNLYGELYLDDSGYNWEIRNDTTVLYWSEEPDLPARAIDASELVRWLETQVEKASNEDQRSCYRSVIAYVNNLPTIGSVPDDDSRTKPIVGVGVAGMARLR